MAKYIYQDQTDRRTKFPYLLSLWSGYYLASLSVSAFSLLNSWLIDSIIAFGGLIFICVCCLLLGHLVGYLLTLRQLQMSRLIHLLASATLLTLPPILLGDSFAQLILQSDWGRNSASVIIAIAPFVPPLLLLSAIPGNAATVIIRNRGSAGVVNQLVLLCTALGYCAGTLVTANYTINTGDPQIMMKMMAALSAIIILLGLVRYPLRKVRGR